MANYDHQTVNFSFSVGFDKDDALDVRFQSVSGLDVTLETETIKEGGENRFEHVLPVRRKYGPLILKRGLIKPSDSGLSKWLKEVFDSELVNEKIKPVSTLVVSLLNEEHKILMSWNLSNVWPRSWKIGDLDAEHGAVLIETLELNYNRLVFTNPQ